MRPKKILLKVKKIQYDKALSLTPIYTVGALVLGGGGGTCASLIIVHFLYQYSE